MGGWVRSSEGPSHKSHTVGDSRLRLPGQRAGDAKDEQAGLHSGHFPPYSPSVKEEGSVNLPEVTWTEKILTVPVLEPRRGLQRDTSGFPLRGVPSSRPDSRGDLGLPSTQEAPGKRDSRAQSPLSVCPPRTPTLNPTWEQSSFLTEMTETPGVCPSRLRHTFGNEAGRAETIAL